MPEKYLIHLLGHDGPKSLSAYLKKKMLIYKYIYYLIFFRYIHSLSAFSFISC